MRFDVFNRFDAYLFSLSQDNCESALHQQSIEGDDTLTLATREPLNKGYRIVWQDKRGRFHEHVVVSSSGYDGGTEQYSCINSMCELYGGYIEEYRPSGTAAFAVGRALEGTRFTVGTVDVDTRAQVTFYHTSPREALAQVVEAWGGELYAEPVVGSDSIVERRVNLVKKRGDDLGKRFVYTKDLVNVSRNILTDEPVTRLYGFGKGEEVGDGYGRRISFEGVNGGKKYVEDPEATEVWGLPDGKGGKAPYCGIVIFEDCTDPKELLELTKAYYETAKLPKVGYEANVVDLEQMGFEHEGADLGDTVAIIDLDHEPEIRVQGRIVSTSEELFSGDKTITVGNYMQDAGDLIAGQYGAVGDLTKRASFWDVAASLEPDFLDKVRGGLNQLFDAGGSYIHFSFEHGLIVSDKELDEEGHPLTLPAMAIQLKGGGFRIASGTLPNGEFDWSTFGTGEGFTADYINAGVIRGGANYWSLDTGYLEFLQGRIGSSDGLTYWDLTEKSFALLEKTGKGLTYKDGKLNIDADYVRIGAQSVKDWTSAEIKVLGDTISTTVSKQLDENTKAISKIEQKFDKISLSVTNGKLGSTASITLNVDGDKTTQSIDMTGVRSAFANDKSTITISAGRVSFGAGTFTVTSTNFTVSSDGTITAKAGTIGGWTISSAGLYTGSKNSFTSTASGIYLGSAGIKLGNTFSVTSAGAVTATSGSIGGFTLASDRLTGLQVVIASNIIDFKSSNDGSYIGSVCATWNSGNSNERFVGLMSGGNASTNWGVAFGWPNSTSFGAGKSFSTSGLKACLSRYKDSTYNINYGWNFYTNVDMHGYSLENANVATASSLGIGGSIQDKIEFVAVTAVNPDGTIAEYVPACSMEFTNGILTDMTKPEVG